ncbi:MAG: FKBP-type peptidyl-prolyl cis-trans isomerase [Henriciella sp.]|nr:FKBP-type peptidyl-prolyl cis-trans isomerase [Henriciella sp.]
MYTTESGLQFAVIKNGSEGATCPGPRDRVSVMYDGRLNDGTVFDSSYERGSTSSFGVNQVISGWTEGLQLMSEGDEFVFFIPSELGYGQNPRPGGVIKPGDDLIFRVELRQVVEAPKPREVDTEAWGKYTPWNSELDGIQKTESGLEYVVLAEGNDAGASPLPNEMVVVYYEGRFADTGDIFDSAFKRGEAAIFPANGVIPGWVEALSMMKPGDRWLVHIPSDLAYGPQGRGPIPPDAALDFEVELMDIIPVQ